MSQASTAMSEQGFHFEYGSNSNYLHSILNRLWKLWVQEQSMYASLQMIQNGPQLPSL